MPNYPILKEPDSLSTPGLWVDPKAVQRNIDQMIADIGGKSRIHRLRPHVKTHKMVEVIEMQSAAGITKCKAATPFEAKAAARGGATDILIAHQLVGPKIQQVADLMVAFPDVKFSVVVDDIDALKTIVDSLSNSETPLPVWIDVDCGMHRSGIAFGPGLDNLREAIESNKGAHFEGLHVYDGHLHDPSLDARRIAALEIIELVRNYTSLHDNTKVVGGGTPTFGIWAAETEWECSPGTTLFWDCGYGGNYPDLKYEVASGLVTRIISKPGENSLCFDLGHKSVSAEMALPLRATFPGIPGSELVSQSEEHLVVNVPDSSIFKIGQAFTAIPRHVCPTVALHAYASVVENGSPTGQTWKVVARDRF